MPKNPDAPRPRGRGALLALAAALLTALVAACSQPASPAPSLALALADDTLAAPAGSDVTVEVSVTRGGGFDGEVAVSTADLPAGVGAAGPVTIPAGATEASLVLGLAAEMPAGDATLTVVAQGNGVLATATLTLAVGEPTDLPAPGPGVVLTLADDAVDAVPGDEITVAFSVERIGGFDGEVAVSTADVPAGVVPPSPVTIAAGATEASFVLTLSESMPAGDAGLTVVAQGNGVLDSAALALDVAELTGRLDASFGTDGVFRLERNRLALNDIALDDGGRIVVGGNWYDGDSRGLIARLNADGTLDASFGSDGVLEVPIGNGFRLQAVALDGEGRVVAVGDRYGPNECVLIRSDANGVLDATFGTDGVLQFSVGSSSDCHDVLVDGDGRIVVAGYAGGGSATIARLNADGTFDASFDGDGSATYAVGSGNTRFHGLVEAADGDLIAAGRNQEPGTLDDYVLFRVGGDGALDTSFDGDGAVVTDFASSSDRANAVALDGDAILAAGYRGGGPGGNEDMALARYNADGSLDASFGEGGKVRVDFFGGYDSAHDLALDGSGGYVLAGYAVVGGYANQHMAVALVDADGDLDPGFNRDGKVVLDDLNLSGANAVAIDADGDILLAGGDSFGGVVVRLTR